MLAHRQNGAAKLVDWITEILKTYGLAGAVIFALAGTVVYLAKALREESRGRLADRDILHKAISDHAASLNGIAQASTERNKITQALADIVDSQSNAFARFADRVDFRADSMEERVKDHTEVVKSAAEATRVLTGVVTDVRGGQSALQAQVNNLDVTIKAFAR